MFDFLRNLFPHYQYFGSRNTVRYAFPLVVIAMLFAGLASVVSENTSYVTISTDAHSVTRDQEFDIDVMVTAHVPVNALDLVIAYPEDKIIIKGIDTGRSVITLWTEEPYAKNGNVYLRGGTFRKGFVGEHFIARIQAQAKEAGDAHFFVKDTHLVAGDGKGSDVAVTSLSSKNEAYIQISGDKGIISGEVSFSIVTDTDGDGDVDLGDVSAFMTAWLTRRNTYDFNGDGKMTFRDFSILLADSFFK
jgi:hypothetical protein